MKNKDAVSQAIVYLFEKEMFYAEIIASMKRISTTQIPTAGVCIRDYIELHINHEWFETMPVEQRAAILKHECEHILRDHIPRAKELAPDVYGKSKDQIEGIINQQKHKTMNIAMDCAINYTVNDLPDGGMYPKTFDLPDGETFEWYLEHMKDNEKAKEMMEFDDHSLWAESEGDKEVLKEKIKQAVNKAADKTRAAGRMTSDNEHAVSKLNTNTVNWKNQLSRFVARTIEVKLESSKKKRNRRYGIAIPGTVKTEELHIGVAIDTSGSVSDQALNQFMAEIGNIAKYAKVTVVEADSSVKNHYIFDPKKTYKVKGRGGTAYQPAFTWFTEESDVDAVIYFGDMDSSDKAEKPKYPVLWAIVGNQDPPADFGSQIRIKVKNE
jgi:predicted metal-dependent peptidase